MNKNRAKRIARKLKELREHVGSVEARCAEIEASNKLDQPVKDRMTKALRKSVGPAQGRIIALSNRADELGMVKMEPPVRFRVQQHYIWKMSETEFAAAYLGRRHSRASRAWRTVNDAFTCLQ